MKNIINSLIEKIKPSSQKLEEVTNNTIKFELMPDDNIKISVDLLNSDQHSSDSFGLFLHELTTGGMSRTIVDILLDLGDDNKNYMPFIKSSLTTWLSKQEEYNHDPFTDKPIISPSEFTSLK